MPVVRIPTKEFPLMVELDIVETPALAAVIFAVLKLNPVGTWTTSALNVVPAPTREVPKIGRNQKVEIKNNDTGEIKTMKFKQAERLILTGEWSINS